jgi:cyclophilin family peptidyl-prolyl cis-trans isomerase
VPSHPVVVEPFELTHRRCCAVAWAGVGLGWRCSGFFTQVGLTRVVPGFLVQFGIAADPRVQQQWNARSNIQDDPMIGTLVKRGTLAYAGSGKNSRGTQIWIAFQDSSAPPPPPSAPP